MSYQITEEQKKILLQYSAQTLPDNPSRDGFSAETIRKRMYKPTEKLVDLVNAVFDTVYTDVQSILSDIQNGDFFARSIASWSASYNYGQNEITFYPSIGTYGAFVQSVVAGNTNNAPYVNGAINSAYWSEVVNFNTIAEDYFNQVQAAVAQAESAASEAESSAQAAAGSATQSAGSAAEAAQSAQAAQTSAEAAQVWEERAANFSENAENSMNTASEYVSEAHNAADAAYTAMQSAQSSATEAQGYADYTKQLVDGLGGVYIPQGSLAFASLPAQPAAQYQGYVWNITDAFTTDSRFLEGAGESVPAGANVACVLVDGAYKYDVLSGIVDLSNYAQINGTYSGMTVGKATNADNATKATQDASGNVITTTYATKTENNAKYTKPSTGIPKGDLASAVQTSLNKADTALQSIPIATPSVVGGVKPVTKTSEMTQEVGVDSNGTLWTKGGGTTIEYMTDDDVNALFVQDELIGTWKLKENGIDFRTLGQTTTFYLTFVSNSITFKSIKATTITSSGWDPNATISYDNRIVYENGFWTTGAIVGNEFSTIQITDISSLTNRDLFATWIKANGTKQSENDPSQSTGGSAGNL